MSYQTVKRHEGNQSVLLNERSQSEMHPSVWFQPHDILEKWNYEESEKTGGG
jgi:hypothetical protein